MFLQTTHSAKLKEKGNPAPHTTPAPRGSYPAARTGHASDSVLVVPSSVQEVMRTLSVKVGLRANAFYVEVLAAKGWKGLMDTLEATRSQLAAYAVKASFKGG